VAEPVVDPGQLDPEMIITPGVYVDHVVYAPAKPNGVQG
jgi:acyl CoA:acetate/3-ketoacid CoA transferase alpha subunit